jgi:hypothetical protein
MKRHRSSVSDSSSSENGTWTDVVALESTGAGSHCDGSIVCFFTRISVVFSNFSTILSFFTAILSFATTVTIFNFVLNNKQNTRASAQPAQVTVVTTKPKGHW